MMTSPQQPVKYRRWMQEEPFGLVESSTDLHGVSRLTLRPNYRSRRTIKIMKPDTAAQEAKRYSASLRGCSFFDLPPFSQRFRQGIYPWDSTMLTNDKPTLNGEDSGATLGKQARRRICRYHRVENHEKQHACFTGAFYLVKTCHREQDESETAPASRSQPFSKERQGLLSHRGRGYPPAPYPTSG